MGGAAAASQLAPDGQAGQFHPGKFIWFDLVADDLPAARKFYGAVFGWRFRTVGPAPTSYTLIEDASNRIGGMFFHTPPPGATRSARWLSLLSVGDPGAVARYVEQHGGSVVAPPTNVVGRGTHALFRDPEGALFGVLKSEVGDPPDTPVADGDFFWLDLLARDPVQAAEFYQGLAGYEISIRELDSGFKRIVLASGGYARAGIAPLPAGVKEPGWLPYIQVDDVAGTLQRVTAAGGQILVQPRETLLDGNLAVVADPLGGVLGIVNWVAGTSGEGGAR